MATHPVDLLCINVSSALATIDRSQAHRNELATWKREKLPTLRGDRELHLALQGETTRQYCARVIALKIALKAATDHTRRIESELRYETVLADSALWEQLEAITSDACAPRWRAIA